MCDLAEMTARPFGHSGVAASAQMLRLIERPGRAEKGKPASNAVKLVELALAKGINFIDVTDVLDVEGIGSLIQSRCEELVLALRFGLRHEDSKDVPDSSRDAMRRTCEMALDKLGVDTIDLFYQELPDPDTAIEDTAEELKALVACGKIKAAGLAPKDGDALRRAHAIQPVAVVPLTWSVWNPQEDNELVAVCRELGVNVLANKALGGGVRAVKFLDSKTVGEKVKRVLDNYCTKVVKKLEKIKKHPAAFLEKRMKTIVGVQFGNLSKMLMNILNKQANVLDSKVKNLLEGQDAKLTGKMENIIAAQKQRATGNVKTLLEKQQEMLTKKIEVLAGLPDAKLLQRLQKIVAHQQHILVTRVTHVRAMQAERLVEALKGKLGQASPIVKKVSKCFNNQSCNLIAKIYWKKGVQRERLTMRVQKIQDKVKAAMAMRVEAVLQKQSSQVSKRIFKILGSHRPLPMCVKKKLEHQRQGLVVKFHSLAEKGADSERLRVVLERMMHRQASVVLSEVEMVVKRRNEHAERVAERVAETGRQQASAPSNEDAKQADAEATAHGAELEEYTQAGRAKMLMTITEGVNAVAKARRVCFNAICVAWLHQHNVRVIPVANVGGNGKCMDALVKGANITLSEEELGKMCKPVMGPDVDESSSLDLGDWDNCEVVAEVI